MKQISLTDDAHLLKHNKRTCKEQFMGEIGQIIPWQLLTPPTETHFPETDNAQPSIPIERALHINLAQRPEDQACASPIQSQVAIVGCCGKVASNSDKITPVCEQKASASPLEAWISNNSSSTRHLRKKYSLVFIRDVKANN